MQMKYDDFYFLQSNRKFNKNDDKNKLIIESR